MNSTVAINHVIQHLTEFLDNHADKMDSKHGLEHVLLVLAHAQQAVFCDVSVTEIQHLIISLACLLHDVDDSKFFKSTNFENARHILEDVRDEGYVDDLIISETINLISLVSCSKNLNDPLPTNANQSDSSTGNGWKLIPRWADRLESLGKIGLQRCLHYNSWVNRPISTSLSPRLTNIDQIMALATPERFKRYMNLSLDVRPEDDSMIGHCYDKLLHIGQGIISGTTNTYFINVAKERHKIVLDFLVEFGKREDMTDTEVSNFLDTIN
jgi:HD superfamily phosphodiesterase